MRSRIAFFILTLLTASLLQPLYAVSAASTPDTGPVSGLTVSPAFSTVQVGTRQPRTSLSIGVKNNSSAAVSIEAALKGLAMQGSSLIPDTKPEEVLSKVISVSPSKATIPAGGSVNILVNVIDDAALSPGGHYASILVSQITDGAGTAQNRLSIEPAISATVYIIKEDGAVRSLIASGLTIGDGLFRLPRSALSTFKNTGNVTAVPRGIVTIRRGEQVYAQGILNAGSLPVFKGASTSFRADLQPLKRAYFPGLYTASLEYRYDGQDASKTLTKTFLHVPFATILFILLDIIIVTLAYRWWHKRPKKRVVKVFKTTPEEPENIAKTQQSKLKILDIHPPVNTASKLAKTAAKKRRVKIDI